MEPVEPPSEQYIDSAAAMIPGAIALSRGKGVLVASGAVAAEVIEDAVTNRAREAADDATGGRLAWIPHPILAILIGARPKAKPGAVNDAAEGVKRGGIYEFPDQHAGGTTYVGQSGDLEARLRQHERNGRLVPGTETTIELPGDKKAREIAEHNRIQNITGGIPASKSESVSNKLDPIGPNRQHLLEESNTP